MKGDFRLGEWLIKPQLNCIAGSQKSVNVEPKVMEVLVYLARHNDEVVAKDQIIRAVWVDTFVSDNTLTHAISELRKALEDDARSPSFIQTIPGRGYRLVAEVRYEVPPDTNVEGERAGKKPSPRRLVSGWMWGVLALLMIVIGAVVWPILTRIEPGVPRGSHWRLTPLTSLPGAEMCPSFSPDGSQVAFAWSGIDGNQWGIYVKSIGPGDPLRLTADPNHDWDPAWSPDGKLIAFLRAGGEVLLIPPLGGAERRLKGIRSLSEDPGYGFLDWSPDAKWLTVADTDADSKPFALYLLSVETAEMRRLTTPPPWLLGDFGANFSPDGNRLAFIRVTSHFWRGDIYVLPLTEEFLPAGEPERITSDGDSKWGLTWSANGEEIIYSDGDKLYQIRASKNAQPEALPLFAEGLCNPRVSRRSNRLACVQISKWKTDIWRIDLVGSDKKSTPPAEFISSSRVDTGPQFSPDGSRVVFFSNREGDGLWISDTDGSRAQSLAAAEGYSLYPTWAPDGTRIAFDSLSRGNRDVWIVNSNGTNPRRLTSNLAEDGSPSWSNKGEWIYFESNRSGDWQIWKVSAQGGEAVQVTETGGRRPQESPDGRFLYYVDNEHLMKAAINGGKPPALSSVKTCGMYDVSRKGIYYIPPLSSDERFTIQYFEFDTGEDRQIVAIDKPFGWGFAVSPDEKTILFAQSRDQEGGDLMMVENFR